MVRFLVALQKMLNTVAQKMWDSSHKSSRASFNSASFTLCSIDSLISLLALADCTCIVAECLSRLAMTSQLDSISFCCTIHRAIKKVQYIIFHHHNLNYLTIVILRFVDLSVHLGREFDHLVLYSNDMPLLVLLALKFIVYLRDSHKYGMWIKIITFRGSRP